MNSTQNTFTAGTIYTCRSICDHECVWNFLVFSRTAKRVTLVEVKEGTDLLHAERKTVGVRVWNGVEQCKPFGTYSMCPVLNADRVATK